MRHISPSTSFNGLLLQTTSPVTKQHSLLNWRLFLLALLFTTALGIRLLYVNDPPLNFHATRQYRSLIIARSYYFSGSTSVPERDKRVALHSKQKQGILEPPIMELMVATGYRILGGEHFWLPRLLSSLFWLTGGVFLYFIGRRVTDENAALFATAFYLFLPFSVVASRGFQPDPLMVMLLLGSVLTILRHDDAPSLRRLIAAAIVSSLAFIVKPHSLFMILSAFAALAIYRRGFWQAVLNQNMLVFLTIILLPTMIIYIYNIVTGSFFPHEAWKTLLPQLWLSSFFWRGWINNIGFTVGFIPFIGALLGILFLREPLPKYLILGLWLGYGVFGLVLNYNLATHDYYQLQLIPIVGLSVGPIVSLVLSHLYNSRPQLHWRAATLGVLSLALILSLAVARSRLVNPVAERKVKVQREIGALVNHSTKTIFLSADYGVPLEYHGLLSGSSWPLQWDLEWEQLAGLSSPSAQQRFDKWFAKDSPEYFIVEDLKEFEQQPDLKEFLARFPLVYQNNDYLVFKLSHT